MGAYTAAAKKRVDNIDSVIVHAIALANDGFQRSKINVQYRLKHSYMSDIEESESIDKDVENFTGTDKHGAAMACLLTDTSLNTDEYCGVAKEILCTSENAYCVCNVDCVDYHSVAHEFGHLMGCRHDPVHDDTKSCTAHGKIIFGADQNSTEYPNGARTIMAYSVNGETRVNQWSNPDVQFLGHPTGTPGWQDCAAQIRQQAPIVAKWASESRARRSVPLLKQQHWTFPRLLGGASSRASRAAKASVDVPNPGASVGSCP